MQLAWAFQRESELLQIINYYLDKMQQTGVIGRQQQEITTIINRDSYNALVIQEPSGLGYDRVIFPFLSLLMGFCIAFIQLGLEAATKNAKRNVPPMTIHGVIKINRHKSKQNAR